MSLPIYSYGHKVLRKKAPPIDKHYPNLSQLIDQMWVTMENAQGVGLAAPQIGKSIRLFIVDTRPLYISNDRLDIHNQIELKSFRQTFINPIITKEEGEYWSYSEGCLSIPTIRENVKRKNRIAIEYLDVDFKQHNKIFEGLLARVIQHEYDHIEGILFTDLLSPFKKRLLKGKLSDIQIGKCEVDYPMRFFS
ncbi:MAG: peptide deformylase [Flavobacteriaceae bacterium]|nr:peptide deformylase [Flavobacteriaceae bacterium]MCY4216828.1 peptide deformylase [Flavobacteriaceae bacterium]MCY4253388.1 peptide deformylase [Flavobacteriaceae bacterium]